MKCASCKQTIATTFMEKIIGTHIKDENGKRHPVCADCQRTKTKEELLAN